MFFLTPRVKGSCVAKKGEENFPLFEKTGLDLFSAGSHLFLSSRLFLSLRSAFGRAGLCTRFVLTNTDARTAATARATTRSAA